MSRPMPARQQVRLSLRIVWMILSLAGATLLIAPWLFAEKQIAGWTPVCEWKAKYNRECPACGLTRSFLRLSRGDASGAWSANRAGPPLYVAIAINSVVFAITMLRPVPPGGRANKCCRS